MVEDVLAALNPKPVFGIGDDFELDHNRRIALLGWQIWRMSGMARFPTRAEVEALEPSWVSDVLFYEQMAEWLTNDSPAIAVLGGLATSKSGV